MGPFDNPPNFHVFPFMSREKSDSENITVIVDLSWPKGNSVNNAVISETYVGFDFLFTLPTIDHVIKAVKTFGKGSYIAKIDISRAFIHVPIDPKDINIVGLKWNQYYLENNLVFRF